MLSESEKQYILHRGASVVADYFRNKVIDNYAAGKAAVLVKQFVESLYFLPCDERGYPKWRQFRTVEYRDLTPLLYNQDDQLTPQDWTVTEYTVIVRRPLVVVNIPDFDEWTRKAQVFLWEGEIADTKK